MPDDCQADPRRIPDGSQTVSRPLPHRSHTAFTAPRPVPHRFQSAPSLAKTHSAVTLYAFIFLLFACFFTRLQPVPRSLPSALPHRSQTEPRAPPDRSRTAPDCSVGFRPVPDRSRTVPSMFAAPRPVPHRFHRFQTGPSPLLECSSSLRPVRHILQTAPRLIPDRFQTVPDRSQNQTAPHRSSTQKLALANSIQPMSMYLFAFGVFISPGGGVLLKTKDRRQKTGDQTSPLSAQTARKNPHTHTQPSSGNLR